MFWHRQNVTLDRDFCFTFAPYVNNTLVISLFCVVYPSVRNAKHTAIFFFSPLLSDQTVRDRVLQRSERQQGKVPKRGGASVVICCKKDTGEQLSTSAA